jgi:excinuclease UvrABC ATPase subunit
VVFDQIENNIGQLMKIIAQLADAGNTVILIKHLLDVIRQADWIIDLGLEGGAAGGEVLFESTPRDLLGAERNIAAKYLNG